MARNWKLFLCSVFFVLGFSLVFSILGILLQTVLSTVGLEIRLWLGRIGGVVIVLFGLYLLGILRPRFLDQEYKLNVKQKFSSAYLTSFVFGAAFAVAWTPCVGAVLGAILTLAISQPSSAFLLMFSYSLGLAIPFLLLGLFANEFKKFIPRVGKFAGLFDKVFGLVLIVVGVLVFFGRLSMLANFSFAAQFLVGLEYSILTYNSVTIWIAFLGGILSFLSPCVLPILPGFFAFLAGIGVEKK